MLQVWYSNELERLVEGLVEAHAVERKRRQQSVFDRTPVVVPNGQLETYLKFAIAQKEGIAAHLKYRRMVEFFASLLPEEAPHRLLDDEALAFVVHEALGDAQVLQRDELRAPRRYLQAAGDDADARELRRFQLASHTATLFREYGFSRPQMVRFWPEGKLFDEPRWRRVETWQRALWLEIFGPGGRLDELAEARGVRYVLLSQLFEHVGVEQLELPAAVHLFSPGHLGRAFEKLLGELSEHTQVHVWALNPCREYWEDVVTDAEEESELLSSRAVDGGQLSLTTDETFWEPETFPPALRLWGRVGRDQMRMFNRLCGHDFNELYGEPTERAETALVRLQHDILHLKGEDETPPERLDDDSIQIHLCADIKREAEAIANEIWALMHGERKLWDDEPLRFHDITVLVNCEQRAAYQTHLEAVFREAHDIPFNMVDLQASESSRLFEAIELLLDLPFGDFKRRELLRLLTHPNLIANLDDVEPDTWLRWCDELEILHGADRTDHRDTYIEEDLFNWDQGLKRLVLGGFMTGPQSGDRRTFRHGQFEYLPHEFPSDEAPSAARLVMCARSLIEEATRRRSQRRSLSDWVTHIGDLVDNHLAPADDDEEFEWMRCRDLFGELAEADLDERAITYRAAREFIADALGKLEVSRGQFLADGVAVSSFRAARPLSHRVVFVAGMGEAYFPTADGADPLDLRRAKWQEGDAHRRDVDKYAFLQTLIAARERLYISYVSRDSQTGEDLEPSSVVRDLEQLLRDRYLTDEAMRRCRKDHPLRRFDERYFDETDSLAPQYHPEARREAAARRLEEDLWDHCREHGVPFPDSALLCEGLEEPKEAVVRAVLGAYEKPPAAAAEEHPSLISLSLSRVRQFLESPLQASARWVLGLRPDDAEDLLEREDEVFEASYVRSLMLAREVFTEVACESAPADEPGFSPLYEEKARHLELQGKLPTGPFREEEASNDLELMHTWRENLEHLEVALDRPFEVKRFGRAERHAPVDEIWDSLTFEVELSGADDDIRKAHVELYGETELLTADLTTSVTLVARKKVKPRDFLRGFVTYLALVAAGRLDEDRPFELIVVPDRSLERARKLSKFRKRIDPIDRPTAIAYLQGLLEDYLSGAHPYLLPLEAVLDYRQPDNETPFDEIVAGYLSSRWRSCSSEYGPIAHPERFSVPRDVEALIERRFGPFLNGISKPEN